MIGILAHPTYAKLFGAQVVALVGTGLLTIALGLLAYDLAGKQAGAVLGTALAIKMIAYVGFAPIANALAERVDRKNLLIGADLVRLGVALLLPLVGEVWQVYLLIFVLQAASASFTPAFQATIPDILPDEADYTKALSLSRLAYELENLASPALAGVLLLVTSYHLLFTGTAIGFLGSAVLVWFAAVPPRNIAVPNRSFGERLTRGSRIYLATPRLRGLLGLNLTAAAASAFVIVNTVVIVRSGYAGSEADVALAFAAFGVGSMVAALALPTLLGSLSDRSVMLVSGLLLAVLTLISGLWQVAYGLPAWMVFLAIWATTGIFYSAVLTPSGRLLRRSAHANDRPSVFAAQFALSHACWLVTYPLAGWVGSTSGLPVAMTLLGGLALAGVAAAAAVWPQRDPVEMAHEHPDLAPDHPHVQEHGGRSHRHVFVIDDEHHVWPTRG